jgi:Nif-specific regulatory protein
MSLRHYVASLADLMEAVEEMDVNAEVMPLLGHILQNAMVLIEAEDASLLVTDDETGELVFVLAYGRVPQADLVGVRVPAGKGIAGWVAQHRKPVIVHNAPSDVRFYSDIDMSTQHKTNTILAVPIMTQNRVLGVIEALNKKGDALFNETDQVLLSLLCRFAGEVLLHVVERDEAETQTSPEPPPGS